MFSSELAKRHKISVYDIDEKSLQKSLVSWRLIDHLIIAQRIRENVSFGAIGKDLCRWTV